MEHSILVVDDDNELCRLIKKCAEKENVSADLAHTGIDGLNMVKQGSYQLIVLDVMLPGMSGLDVLSQIRKSSSIPILRRRN